MLGNRAAFLLEHLDLTRATGGEVAEYEPYQLAMWSDEGMFAVYVKSRQIGWSWTAAADAVAECYLQPGVTCVFTSINLEEAKEKVRYAKMIDDSLDNDVRMKLDGDSMTSIRYTNGSRMMSGPARAVRGKPRARVYLDEFAHYREDRTIYTAALPATTQGGRIRIGSTPYGARGMFHDITMERTQTYPGYRRLWLPWWRINLLCTDVVAAGKEAPGTPTEWRVDRFGTERLKAIFANMMLDDFQQEYELNWVDESVSYFSWDEIMAATRVSQQGGHKYWKAYNKGGIDTIIRGLRSLVKLKAGTGLLYVGMDIGRRKDVTEVMVLDKEADGVLWARANITLPKTAFNEQEIVVDRLCKELPVVKMFIDETGIGMQLAENAELHHPGKAEGFMFTRPSKELLAVATKVAMQQNRLMLPADRNLLAQIHSIRRIVTPSNQLTLDTDRSEKHHADAFWALALAVYSAEVPTGVFLR